MKRRIGRSRRRKKRSSSGDSVVIPTGVGEILSRLSPNDDDNNKGSVTEPQPKPLHSSLPEMPTKSKKVDEALLKRYRVGLRKAMSFCQEQLKILDKLKQLRDERVSQLRNQGEQFVSI